jgi:hypothetical protein
MSGCGEIRALLEGLVLARERTDRRRPQIDPDQSSDSAGSGRPYCDRLQVSKQLRWVSPSEIAPVK